jgi:hypothetical protein
MATQTAIASFDDTQSILFRKKKNKRDITSSLIAFSPAPYRPSTKMSKSKKNSGRGHKSSNQAVTSRSTNKAASSTMNVTMPTTSVLAADPRLGYKVRVLIHDLLNVTKDPNSERRINSTTNEHYISTPYFDKSQSEVIKSAIVDVDVDLGIWETTWI